jgi:hypothetical protein
MKGKMIFIWGYMPNGPENKPLSLRRGFRKLRRKTDALFDKAMKDLSKKVGEKDGRS